MFNDKSTRLLNLVAEAIQNKDPSKDSHKNSTIASGAIHTHNNDSAGSNKDEAADLPTAIDAGHQT